MSSKKATGSIDRISNLPGEIKQQILCLLSTSDAIRTSVLSSDWRYEWISLPSLNFGHKFWKNSQKKKLTDNQDKSVANHHHHYHHNGCNFSAKKELALDDIDNDNEDHSEGNDCSERNKLVDGDYSALNLKALGYVQFLDRVIQMIRTHQPNETRKLRIHLPGDIGFGSTSVSMDLVTTGDELQRLSCYVQEYRFLRSGRRAYLLDLPRYLSASSKSLSTLELTGNLRCKMFKSMSMEGTGTEFSSLRKISISCSRLDQWVVDALLARCGTVLEELMLLNCKGLKSLKLSGLPKLSVLQVETADMSRVKINAPQLHSLRLGSLRSVKLASCRNLVELSIHSCCITNDIFNRCLAKFPCLKKLHISTCPRLTHIVLASNSLAVLFIFYLRNLLRLEIDTPSLISFSYSMCEKSDFLSLVSHTPMASLAACLYLTPRHAIAINRTQWHSKVVELLASFSCAQEITITWTANEALIIPQDLRESLSPPLWGVQYVYLSLHLPTVLDSGRSILQYLDTVLWLSSRPKGIYLSARGIKLDHDSYEDSDEDGHEDLGSWAVYLELQYKKDAGDVEHSCGCYPGRLINCWRHSLKDFEIKYQNRLEDAAILTEFFDNALAERRKS